MKTKTTFSSLEFIIGENTYWWTSDFSREVPYFFRVIPKKVFEGLKLKTGIFLSNGSEEESRFSSITEFDDGSREFMSDDDESPICNIDIDLSCCEEKSWNEMARFVLENSPAESAVSFYHKNIVRKNDLCKFEIPDDDYQVTAFVPEEVFAIIGSKYSKDNPCWFSLFSGGDIEYFKNTVRQFDVVAASVNNQIFKVK